MKEMIWIVLLMGSPITAMEAQKLVAINTTKVNPLPKAEALKGQRPELNLKSESKDRKENEKVQKRGFLDFHYIGDKFDHGYYGHDVVTDLPIPETTPSVFLFPTLPPEFLPTTTTTTPAPPIIPPSSGSPIDLGQSTTIEKTITLYKGIPVPYPVIKHVAVPVEKHIHVPVKVHVPVPAPYPVEKTVHVPVKVPIKVHVPQPYPVNKYIPVKVFVDKPYPVFVPNPADGPKLPIPIDPCTEHKIHHHGHVLSHLESISWKPEGIKPEDVHWGPPETIPGEETDAPIFYDKLPENFPQFVTLQKPTPDFEKFYTAASNVNNYSKKKLVSFRGPDNKKYQELFLRPDRPHTEQKPLKEQGQRQYSHHDGYDDHDKHSNRYYNGRNSNNSNNNKYNNYRDLREYQDQNRKYRNSHRDYRGRQEHRELKSPSDEGGSNSDTISDELVLHGQF